MRDATSVPATVGDWFRRHREQYRWPESSYRKQSEQRIDALSKIVGLAFMRGDTEDIKDALIKIHEWKSRRTANRHKKVLDGQNSEYFERLLGLSTYSGVDELEKVIRHLKIDFCNLPVCTAIASFLYGRKNVPIIDNYVAQFFSRRFNINRNDEEMRAVLSWIDTIHFNLQPNGTKDRKLRMAVYTKYGFKDNLRMYINEFVPECQRVAKALNEGGCSYSDVDGESWKFTPVDVEMSIFSWSIKNKNLADVTLTGHRYIIRKASILSGEPIVKGTRTPVRAIVENSRLGYTPEEILKSLPHLSLEEIYDAISYGDDHTDEIEEYIERNRVPAHFIHTSVRDR